MVGAMAHSYPISRRRFVGAATAGLVAGPMLLTPDGATAHVPSSAGKSLPRGLFTLGVASGDPTPDGIVLWTRLAPRPLAGGGMPDRGVQVEWELAEDAQFTRDRRTAAVMAHPLHGHAVHVEVAGLRPDTEYFYRFRANQELSPIGRTRTAPEATADLRRLRFAFASCQDYESGFYTAYQHLVQEDIAFVAFLGDYIYEGEPNPAAARLHEGTGEPYSLRDYRNRHAQYRSDPDLQRAHATFPWIVTLDDHELDNNWADEIPQDPALQSPAAFRSRRRAAFQAYYEHMPLRRESVPSGLDMRVHRRLRFGSLASLHVLDTRQHRSDQPATLAAAESAALTMTGADQERWLVDGMRSSGTAWNLLANQVMWATNDRKAGPEQVYDFDNWDGYRAQRRRLLEFFGSGQVANTVVLTGDRHCTWVCDLKPNFNDPASPVVAAEITGTSITSGGNPNTASFHATYDPIMAESPHWKYIDNQRGYVVCDLSRDRLISSLRLVDTVWAQSSSVRSAAEFVVESGRPGIAVSYQEARQPRALATGPRFAVKDDQDSHPLR
jgi:alkaline phosphatase D